MASAMSLNPCHVMVVFADRSNEGIKPMDLNFIGANWMNYVLQGPKSNWRILQGSKTPFTLYSMIMGFLPYQRCPAHSYQ
jgi:hypothetical protein